MSLSVVNLLFYPMVWTLHPSLVGGVSFREASLPILELLLIALAAVAVGRAVMERRSVKMFQYDKQRYLIAVAIVSYVGWCLQFDEYRFLIPIEMLSFTLIFICLQAISAHIGWKPLVTIGSIALALICVISEQPMNWGRSEWSATYFSVSIPKSLQHRSAAFLMLAGDNPDGYVVPSFPQDDYFAQVEGNLPPTPFLRKIIARNVSAYRDAFAIWEGPVSNGSMVSFDAEGQVEAYGYQIDWNSCDEFPADVGAVHHEFQTCRLKKVSVSTLSPATRVLKPVNHDQLVGHQVLDAAARSAVGLRKVEFAIAGEGRTVNVKAALSLVGWIGFWNTQSVPNGIYTVHSIAYGRNGRVAVSAGVTVAVRN